MKLSPKISITCLFLLVRLLPVCAQPSLKYKADVQKIDSGGFYQIRLDRDLVAKSLGDLKDIRLMNEQGHYVAYILSSRIKTESPQSFIAFPEVHTTVKTDTGTVYIALNTGKLNVNRLWIRLKNTAVNRSLNLYGSDDLKSWFAIKEGIGLQEADTNNSPEYEQSLDFPTSNYRYFKVQVNDKNKAPVKILRSGIYVTNYFFPDYDELPQLKFKVSDSGKMSHVYISLDKPYLVNKLHFNITAPKFFSRKVVIYNRESKSHDPVWESTLNSSNSRDIGFQATKSRHFEIAIDNGDDNPLDIKSITAYQEKQFLITYLEGGHSYYILTGDPAAKEVKYDLSFLEHQPANLLPTLTHSALYKNAAYAMDRTFIVKRDFSPLIWIAIAVVLILLSLLTWRMVKEMGAK